MPKIRSVAYNWNSFRQKFPKAAEAFQKLPNKVLADWIFHDYGREGGLSAVHNQPSIVYIYFPARDVWEEE
jgi:hypothetical protein